MDILALTEFFMWCTLINAAMMAAGVTLEELLTELDTRKS